MPDLERARPVSRRQFLQGMAALAGTTLAACSSARSPSTTGASGAATTSGDTTAAASTSAAPAVSGAATGGGALTVGTVGDLTNLDPFVMTFVNYPMMENVYDQFVRLDNKIKPSPAIIQEWTPSSDGLSLTLKVRQGVKYHDGSPATGADVVQCIKRAAVEATGGNQYPNWQDATTQGNDVVKVTLKQAASYIIPAMGFLSLIKPSAFESLKNTAGGSGPFKVKEWVPGDHLDLEKFENYWDAGKPLLDRARIRFFADEAAMVVALEGGTIDAAISLPPREYERLKGTFTVQRGQEAANFYYLGMNPTKPPFDKKEVRQAMALALDKATMTKNVLFGISEPIATPWPSFSPGHFSEFDTKYQYNLDEAKKLRAQAGMASGFQVTIPTANSFPEFAQFGEILKASLAQIGVTVNIQQMDAAQWVPILLKGDYGAIFSFAGGTQWFPTRLTLSNNFSVTGNTVWPNGIPPKAYVDGLNKTDASFDPAAQQSAMKQAITAFMDEMWIALIAFRYTLFAMQKQVQGLGFGVYDQLRLHDATITK